MKNKTITQSLILGVLTLVHINTIAQNSGPNTPDFSRFEPVDATDMVNLLTGDFVYTLPILSVPNRGYGAHPIALSYSAGIMPNQEASWVGLGWTLNPGSIKPNINGTPDDHAENKKIFYSSFNGTRTYTSIGIGVGLSEYISANIGYTWGSEGYNSLSGGVGVSKSLMKTNVGPFETKVGKVSLGLSNEGVSYKSNLVSASLKLPLSSGVPISSSIGLTYSNSKFSNTGGVGISATAAAAHKDRNYSTTTTTTNSSNFSIAAVIKSVGASISFSKTIQKIKQLSTNYQTTYGNLYPYYSTDLNYAPDIDSQTDMLKIPYNEFGYYSKWFNRNNNILTYPAKDSYTVYGQGISGDFSLEHNEKGFLHGTKEVHHEYDGNATDETFYYLQGGDYHRLNQDKRYEFHFSNEKSYSITTPSNNEFNNLDHDYLENNIMENITYKDISGISSYKDNQGNLHISSDITLIGSQDIPKLGRQNIEWFTNEEIAFNHEVDGKTPKARGFIEASCLSTNDRKWIFGYLYRHESGSTYQDTDYEDTRSKRNQAKSIGAYSITTVDGLTYNYSLPVYNYETVNTSSYTKSNGDQIQQLFAEPDKYVTNWLLTSIVGPDYIDVNNNGPDEDDYGYWVEFHYGHFTDGYQWKFPYSEQDEESYSWKFKKDMSSKSIGRKDIYYLNSIQTKSHTAFFVKDSRTDALGSDDKLNEPISDITIQTFSSSVLPPHKTLRLSKIILLENKDAYLISNTTGNLPGYSALNDQLYMNLLFDSSAGEEDYESRMSINRMANILDQADITSNYSTIEDKALQIIEFNQDYSLGQNCDNCYSGGKLTLNSIDVKAQGGYSVLPPYEFTYNTGSFNQETIPSQYLDLKKPSESNAKLDKDIWGYYTGNGTNHIPDEASLKEIKTPTGSVIAINYEEDEYRDEYAIPGDVEYPVYGFYPQLAGISTVNIPTGANQGDYDGLNNIPSQYFLELSKPLSSAFSIGDEIKVSIHIEALQADQGILYDDSPFSTSLGFQYGISAESCDANPNFCENVGINETVNAEILSVEENRRFVQIRFTAPEEGEEDKRKKILKVCTSLFDENLVAVKDIYDFWDVKIGAHETPGNIKGGGLRVKDIALKNNGSVVSRIQYDYSDPSNLSYGYTSYTPTNIEYVPYQEMIPSPNVLYKTVKVIAFGEDGSKELTTEFRHNVPTGSTYDGYDGYEYSIPDYFGVKDENDFKYVPEGGETEDGFYYVKQNWGSTNSSSNHYKALSYRNTTIDRMFSNIGSLDKVITTNNLNQKNSSTSYYYHSENKNDNEKIGVHQESYLTKRVNVLSNSSGLKKRKIFNVQTSVRDYQILKGTEVSVANGLRNTTRYKDYDVLSGSPMAIISENSFGDRFRTKNIPAHLVYAEMGPKTDDVSNKNMLIQNAASYLLLDDGDNDYTNDKFIEASVSTWKKDWKYREFKNGEYQTTNQYPNSTDIHTGVWRKNTTYSWRSKLDPATGAYLTSGSLPLYTVDGSINPDDVFDTDDEFNFESPYLYELSHPGFGWVKNAETSLYNHSSEAIEVKDINGQYTAVKQWNGLTVSQIIGAAYSGYCSSTAEEKIDSVDYNETSNPRYFETETQLGSNASLTSTNSHTGKHSIFVTNGGDEAFISNFKLKAVDGDKITPQDYFVLSVWVKGNIGADANNVAVKVHRPGLSTPIIMSNPDIITTGDWKQLRYTFKMTNSVAIVLPATYKVSVGAAADCYDNLYFDDYRFYPVGASMTNYVYDDQNRVEYILNENNLGTKYEYNERGQLWKIYTEKVGADGGFKLTSESEMHYGEE